MRPPIWQLIREAMQHFNREVSYAELKQHLWAQYPDLNNTTLNCQIIICSVNQPSRIHYPENKKPRTCDTTFDFLHHTGRGRIEPYDPEKHGLWNIVQAADGTLAVHLDKEPPLIDRGSGEPGGGFPLESHLRDYLAKNLVQNSDFGPSLNVYVSPEGRDGVEFQTDVGPIDILATAANGDFYVFELKLGRGPDAALGQILRYMGWVNHHLANGKKVFGVILAAEISPKLKYAAT